MPEYLSERPSAERAAKAAEHSAQAMGNIASALWEVHNHPTPLVEALSDIAAGLHRIADAMGAPDDDG